MKFPPLFLLLLLLPGVCRAQHTAIDSLAMFHEVTSVNSGKIQQEMIYLHLDNTSYYRGERLHFALYLLTSGRLRPSNLSKTVYVELLNPGGKVIDRCTLPVKDGRAHGSLLVDETPFYSGYYEIRAYTRYMLNFGPEAIYSRVIPVFAAPQTPGEHRMSEYGKGQRPFNRPKPEKPHSPHMQFYPEGGNMVVGLPARVAFELTDEARRPLPGEGWVVSHSGEVVARFEADSMGHGAISFVPAPGQRYHAEIGGRKYNLPDAAKSGIVLSVEPLQHPDSVTVSVARSADFPAEAVGLTFSCRGRLCGRAILDLGSGQAAFTASRTKWPTGVIQATIFSAAGQPLASRLFFNNRHDYATTEITFNKPSYQPFEPIEITAAQSRPAPFSVSVTDGTDFVEPETDMPAELLLASEIKGYVYRPAWYFQPGREAELDRLLMVQGWRRYSWSQLAGMEELRLDSLPEQGIELTGQVIGALNSKPKGGVTVTALLQRVLPADSIVRQADAVMEQCVTDPLGRFRFRGDLTGDWVAHLTTTEKNKKKGYKILMTRSARPQARGYDPGELRHDFAAGSDLALPADTTDADDTAPLGQLTRKDAHQLRELEVTARRDRAAELRGYVENAEAAYDVAEARQLLYDQGKKYIRRLVDILPLIDGHFTPAGLQSLRYRGKEPLYVIDLDMGANEKVTHKDDLDYTNPADLPVDLVKSVYINTQPEAISEYAVKYFEERGDWMGDSLSAPNDGITHFWTQDSIRDYGSAYFRQNASRRFGCVVFVQLSADKHNRIRNGMRRSLIQGYTPVVEFYSPDYSDIVPDEEDRRRTLYWNPSVEPNADGSSTRLRFYNNATTHPLRVTTATLPY